MNNKMVHIRKVDAMGIFDFITKTQEATETLTKKLDAFASKSGNEQLETILKTIDSAKGISKKAPKEKRSKVAKNESVFKPDFSKTEYENWLDFLSFGGASSEWEQLKHTNMWVFRKDAIKQFEKYQKEVKPISDKYYTLMLKIENDWSVLYNLNSFNGKLADGFEMNCKEDIELYKRMRLIDEKYGEKTATNIPAYKRLAMLYEKQGKFEDAVSVCKEAFLNGMDERNRMVRMIKKAGRLLTKEELALLEYN